MCVPVRKRDAIAIHRQGETGIHETSFFNQWKVSIMRFRTLCLSIAAIMPGMIAFQSQAAEDSAAPVATGASGTHATRSAERKKNRAAIADANKKGQLAGKGEASMAPVATAASGTHATRSAERKKNRAAMAEANKKGEIPVVNEGGGAKK